MISTTTVYTCDGCGATGDGTDWIAVQISIVGALEFSFPFGAKTHACSTSCLQKVTFDRCAQLIEKRDRVSAAGSEAA